MKKYLFLPMCLLSLVVLPSCDSARKEEKELVNFFRKASESSDNLVITSHLTRENRNKYVGYVKYEANGETVDFPIRIYKDESGARQYEYAISQEEVDLRNTSFLVRANHIITWGELRPYLSGSLLSEYDRYDKEMTRYLENNIFRTHTTSYMEHNNRYVNNYIKPFVDKLGGNPNIYQSLIITEGQRAQDEQEFHDWSRQAVKDARNKWIDDNPQEARRRGITKF